MKKILSLAIVSITISSLFGQSIDKIINESEVKRIESALASDEMQGRKVFTPGIEKAATFIATEFGKTGLQSFNESKNYLQEFIMLQPKFVGASAILDGQSTEAKNVIAITSKPELLIDEKSGFEVVELDKAENFFTETSKYVQSGRNMIVIVDSSNAKNFTRLTFYKRQLFKSDNSIVFLLTNKKPTTYTIKATHEIVEQKLSNVVGVLPGKSKKKEYVIFSAHYDHLGIGKTLNGDSIYNGANDDAAGVTAIIMLANYYKVLNNNERTLIFVAFTAEETGGYGSRYFSKQIDPKQVMAMFNIEMIGTESKWGKNSAFVTGYEKTDMGTILEKNLQGSTFKFYPDPYPKEQLFYRSDNAALAKLGVPAHTISTSKMDTEPNYHKPSDEVATLDLANMTEIIKAIAVSAKTIVSGKDSPSRVNTSDLK